MCFNKRLRKQVEELNRKVEELNNVVISQELERLRYQEKNFKEEQSYLSRIKLNVKKVARGEDPNTGLEMVAITYEIPNLTLVYDENGKLSHTENFEAFKAINMLNLISMDDADKIKKVLGN